MANAFDHRSMIERVRKNDTAREKPRQSGQSRRVGDIPGSEQQSRLLLVQISKLAFELDVQAVGAGNVARAPRSGPHAAGRIDQRINYVRILGLPQIVVGAPDDDAVGTRHMVAGIWELAGQPLKVCENPIASLGPYGRKRLGDYALVVEHI